MAKLLVATTNAGKMRELRTLLAPLDAELVFPPDLGLWLDVCEDGATYLENAKKKASAYAQASGLPALADDSGLEVDALDGAPGLHSARYAPGDDTDRVAALLAQLRGVAWQQRTARFRCVTVIQMPTGEQYTTEGVVEGLITYEPKGQNGFGYDPVFYLPEYACTVAGISEDLKNQISHRGRAIQAALPILRQVLVDPAAGEASCGRDVLMV